MRRSTPWILLVLALSVGGCKSCRSGSAPAPAGDAAASSASAPSPESQMIATDAHVEEVLRSVRPQLNACYRSALRRDPKASGRAVFKLVINPDGKVKEVALESTTADPELVGCSRVALGRVTFAPTANGQVTTLGVPIDFTPPANPDAAAPAP